MAYFAIFLTTGNSIWGLNIRASTIKRNLCDITKMHQEIVEIDHSYQNQDLMDVPNAPMDKTIKYVLNELKRWETVKDLKDLVTIPMFIW